MISLDPKHLNIVKEILSGYDYSFFAFGSRVHGHPKKFSDLDLLYYEKIDSLNLSKLEEAFEESDLPFRVDLVSYHGCDPGFQQLLSHNVVCLQSSSRLRFIENNHLQHFMYQPKILGYPIDVIDGVTVINCALGTSMFNIAYGAPSLDGLNGVIVKIKNAFGGQPFAWWIPPSERHPMISYTMVEHGFQKDVTAHAMICDVSNTLIGTTPMNLSVKPVTDTLTLNDFLGILRSYDALAIPFFQNIDVNALFKEKEKLFIGKHNAVTTTIAMLLETNSSCAVFTLMTQKGMQKKGYATAMMEFLIDLAKRAGCQFLTLSASSDSGYRIYERLGFMKISEFDCFEYLESFPS